MAKCFLTPCANANCPTVGMPTPGYVIWTSSFSLTDGTKARIPSRGVFRMDGTNMENQGEKPDIQIWVTPEEWLEGKDPQLEQALKLLEPNRPAPHREPTGRSYETTAIVGKMEPCTPPPRFSRHRRTTGNTSARPVHSHHHAHPRP